MASVDVKHHVYLLTNQPTLFHNTEEAVGNFTAETAPPTTLTPLSATSGDTKSNVAVQFDINNHNSGNRDAGVVPSHDGSATSNHNVGEPGAGSPGSDGDTGNVKIDLSDGEDLNLRCACVYVCVCVCVCGGGWGGWVGEWVCVCVGGGMIIKQDPYAKCS